MTRHTRLPRRTLAAFACAASRRVASCDIVPRGIVTPRSGIQIALLAVSSTFFPPRQKEDLCVTAGQKPRTTAWRTTAKTCDGHIARAFLGFRRVPCRKRNFSCGRRYYPNRIELRNSFVEESAIVNPKARQWENRKCEEFHFSVKSNCQQDTGIFTFRIYRKNINNVNAIFAFYKSLILIEYIYKSKIKHKVQKSFFTKLMHS